MNYLIKLEKEMKHMDRTSVFRYSNVNHSATILDLVSFITKIVVGDQLSKNQEIL